MPGRLILKIDVNHFHDQRGFELVNELGLSESQFVATQLFPNRAEPSRNAGPEIQRIYELEFSEMIDIKKLERRLASKKMVEYCEPRYLSHLAFTPNDPSFGSQSFLNQISAPDAWDIEKGDSNVVIAIVDAGIALNHPDLRDQIWKNRADPLNGLDDDMDGYPDNLYGWNLVDNNSNIEYTDSDHGVHVAGLAAAATDNSVGVAGLAFGCKLMPLMAGKRTEVTHGYDAIIYAADHGADIINCSWGEYYPSFLGKDAVEHASSQGALVVAAAGNGSSDAKYYPAAYPEVMSVVAVDPLDQKAGLSNYGFYMDIAAPGLALLSTTGRTNYNTKSGTSTSAPLVSAAAALIKSKNPSYSADLIRELLKQSSDTIPSGLINNSYINKMGAGRLNVFRALNMSGVPIWKIDVLGFQDNNDQWFGVGDSLNLNFSLTSMLQPSSNLSCTLRSKSQYLTVVDSTYMISNLAQDQLQTFNGIFNLAVGSSVPVNTIAEVELLISGNGIQRTVGASLELNTNYLNVEVNRLRTTASSHGLIGYNKYPEVEGLGLIYESGASLMYEGGFMLGAVVGSSEFVFDRLRGPGDIGLSDWKIDSILTKKNARYDFLAEGTFNDSSASQPLGISVRQKVWAMDSTGLDATVVLEYEVTNKSGQMIEELYAALGTDFDIGDYLKNKASFDGQRYLAYTYSDESADQGLFLGSQLLYPSNKVRVYQIAAEVGGEGGIEIDDQDVFTKEEKFELLSGSKQSAGMAAGTDVYQFIGAGPLSLAPNESTRFVFAIHAAPSLDSLQKQADNIYSFENGRLPTSKHEDLTNEIVVYPNPFTDQLIVSGEDISQFQIFDMQGRLVHQVFKNNNLDVVQKLDLSFMEVGTYILELRSVKGITKRPIIKH